MTPRVPDLLVEQLRLGELSPEAAREVTERLAAEPGGDRRIAALDADDRATLTVHPPHRVAAEIRLRAGQAQPRSGGAWGRWMWLGPALVAAAALFAVGPKLSPLLTAEVPHEGSNAGAMMATPSATAHGATVLRVHRAGIEGLTELEQGAEVRSTDRLAVSVVATERRSAALLTQDGDGTWSLLWGPAALEVGATRPAMQTVSVDPASLDGGLASVVLVSSEQAFDVAEVLAGLGAGTSAPEGVQLQTFALQPR